MYLTAHRVRTVDDHLGTNGAVYRGGDYDGSVESLRRIAEGEHGPRRHARADVVPGGNSVEAYLDVAAPDDASIEEVAGFLRDARSQLHGNPYEHTSARYAMRFSCDLGLEGSAGAVLDALIDAVLAMLRGEAGTAGQTIDIQVDHQDRVWCFTLDAGAVLALRQSFPGVAVARSLRVPFDDADAFRRAYGRMYPTVVELLTTKSVDQLEGFTVRFHRGEQTLWQWPV
jgi:hypothetical protein